MGRRNKVVKLTAKKVGYINRSKIRNDSNRNSARDMKISIYSKESMDALVEVPLTLTDKEVRQEKESDR